MFHVYSRMKVAKASKVSFGIHLFLSVVSLFILVNVYQYLEKLKTCSCFLEQQNPDHKINVTFLQFYQVLEIISLFIFICFMTMYKSKLFKGGATMSKNLGMRFFVLLSAFVFFIISGYVTYQSILLFLMAKKDCACLEDWQRYIVYVQGIFNSIYFLRLLLWFALIVILILFNFVN